MDDRARLSGVLHELRELGVEEWYFDGLTAAEAAALLRGARSPAPGPSRATPGTSTTAAPPSGTPLQVLAAAAAGCTRCRLAEGRTQVVFGRGDPEAQLVVVGEAPGGEEDRQGLPFVGPAGKLLDLLLLAAGFPRERVYICNVLKCRPPRNRDPQADEVASCASWLHGQLEVIRPKVLLAVGKFAGQTLSGSDASISRLRGVVHSFRGIPVVATYHPAYLLRTPHATRRTWQDFQLMRRVLDEHD
ncbi:MAG TPA: uracil-DNA glycosylase [Longimicrobiales bacterium]|nr:uracil-DNA glycosylase [Longimicrobiales bacterium]